MPELIWDLGKPAPPAKRKVVTLDDVRKEYQEELDRVARIEANQFAFNDGDVDMDAMDTL